MREVRVERLGKVAATDRTVRILANSRDLVLVFPRALFEEAIAESSPPSEPALEELATLKQRPEEHTGENSFATVVEDVPRGSMGSDQRPLRARGRALAAPLRRPGLEKHRTRGAGDRRRLQKRGRLRCRS